MAGSIFLRQPDGNLVEMSQQAYDSEDLLQRLLADYPNLLAGDEMTPNDPRRWILVSREAGIPDAAGSSDRWWLDHLFLDQDGIPTLVEVKRSSNTQIRREVVGQMLDYVANATVHWPFERIRGWFEGECERRHADPAAELEALLGEDGDSEEFWEQVRTNLYAGRVRLVFVADAIPSELQRIIEFLNGQMDPASVVGVAVPQFVGEGLQTLAPRLVGVTAESTQRKSGASRRSRLTREQLLQQYTDAALRSAIEQLLSESDAAGARWLMGDKGCSLRLARPGWRRPISIAWLFPPQVSGWMGLRDLTLGYSPDSVELGHPARPALDAYVAELERSRAGDTVELAGVTGVHLSSESLVSNLQETLEAIRRLCKAVPERLSA